MAHGPTTLWHVPISHFSEKARWALDVKGVPHRRQALPAGVHPLVTAVLTRGRHQTVPVLTIGTRAIGDSSAIIAELDARFPEPPLIPADPEERDRALALEDWLDEEVGPAVRRWGYHLLTSDPDARAGVTRVLVPWLPAAALPVGGRAAAFALDARFRVRDEQRAEAARLTTLAALDRLEEERAGRDHLVGDRFSVADLTAASLLYPLVLPPDGPWPEAAVPEIWRREVDALRDHPACRWVAATYARSRRPAGA